MKLHVNNELGLLENSLRKNKFAYGEGLERDLKNLKKLKSSRIFEKPDFSVKVRAEDYIKLFQFCSKSNEINDSKSIQSVTK